jgi:hypothetical protein
MLKRFTIGILFLVAIALLAIAQSAVDITGQWTWKMAGPGGQDVEAPCEFKQEGSTITGFFLGGPDRKLPIIKGSIDGNKIKLTVKRDRPQGGEMVYEMSGTVEGNEIQGEVETEMEGQKMSLPWSAKRSK